MVALREEYFLIYLARDHSGSDGRCCALIEAYIRCSVTVQIVCARCRDIDAEVLMSESLAVTPSHKVVIAEILIEELDCALPSDFKNHACILSGDIRIAGFRRQQIWVRGRIGCIHVDVRHTYSVSQRLDGLLKILLGQCAQLRLCLGIVQVHLGGAEDRKIIVGSSVEVCSCIHSKHILSRLIAGNCIVEVRCLDLVGAHTLVVCRTD